MYKMNSTGDKYLNGVIYRLQCNDSYYYIGSTINNLNARISCHKFHSKQFPEKKLYKHINNIGWDNVEIELVEEFSCSSKKELNKREDYYIQAAKNMNDVFCLNLNRAYVTKEEKKENMKKYAEENKTQINEYNISYREKNAHKIKDYKDFYNIVCADKKSEYNKKYAEENEEKVKNARKKYYEENKETIVEKTKVYVETHKEKVTAYKKKWAEEHKEETALKSKIFREAHKEEIKEKGKKYYEENKEVMLEKAKKSHQENIEKRKEAHAKYRKEKSKIIQCECGATITLLCKTKHMKRKQHIAYVEQINLKNIYSNPTPCDQNL